MHIAQFLYEYPELSGPSEVMRGLARAMLRRDCRVTLYGCGESDLPARERENELREAKVVLDKPASRNPFAAPPAIVKSLRETRPDVLILHSMFSPMLVGLARAARREKIPYILCPHNPYHPELLNKNRMQKKIYAALFERPMLRSALAAYLLAESHIEHLRAFGVDTPTLVLPNGFDPENIPEIGTRSARPAGPLRLLFLGRIEAHQKGLDLLFEAVAKAIGDGRLPKDLQLRMAGPDWGSLEMLKGLAGRLGIQKNVEFIGRVDHKERWAQMQWADLLVLPSRFEGFPMVIVESMVAGTPVLLSVETGVSEIVRKANCGYLTAPETGAVADTLTKAFQQQDQWIEMGLRGRAYAFEHLTWDQVANKATGGFQQLLSKGGWSMGQAETVRSRAVNPS